jgi:transglutaminase-like putative cysteine protease
VRALIGLIAGVSAAAVTGTAAADTLFVEGRMSGRVTIEIAERYDPPAGMEWLRLKSYRTPSFASATWKQTIVTDDVTYALRPTGAEVAVDAAGNSVLTERWERPRSPVELVRRLVVDIEASLAPVESRAPFPPGKPVAETARYLAGSLLVQRDDARIQDTARRLTARATTQHEAVTSVMNFVTDHLKWNQEPPGHDALTGLTGGVVNCQGYAHLSLALLRAVGIPARAAVGITLAKGWVVPADGGPIVFKMGTGRHAWVEVFYPDVGWVPFDPQSTHLFVSLYHVRQAVGLDVGEATTIISGAPGLPGMQESFRGDGAGEAFNFRTISRTATPRNYIAATRVREAATVAPPPVSPPPVAPPAVAPPPAATPPPVIRQHEFTQLVEFGNVEFPASLRIFGTPRPSTSAGGVEAGRAFVVETADYATGPDELAQAFTTNRPLLLSDVSLALQKFGGRSGELWLELFEDHGRRPGARVAESDRLRVGRLIDRGGYRWVVFSFAPQQVLLLPAGRYWAVLRSTGDGIFNWYFSLGNAYGDPDDSRAGRRGANDWPAILNYRFNFRVSGLVKP